MASVFSPPKAPKPPPVDNSAAEQAAAEAAAREAERLRKRRRGIQGTILTGPLGISGTPSLRRTTLG